MKTKTQQNFIIDAIMFLIMMALAGTGFLTRYVLLSGQAGKAVFGQKVEMSMLGIGKETWHDIHLYLGFLLLFLLVLHIVLHWKQITILYGRFIQADKLRHAVLALFILLSILLVIFPFILSPTIVPGELLNQGGGHG